MRSLESVFQEAISWLASEHKYFGDLQKDLRKLKSDLEQAKTKQLVRDIRSCFKDFRYVALSEARFNQREQQVESVLQELLKRKIALSGSIGEIQSLLQRLQAEARSLIHDSSRYDGEIKRHLVHLQLTIQDHEIDQAQAVLMELTQLIESVEKWIAALSRDLNEAKKIMTKSEVPGARDSLAEEPSLIIQKCKLMYKLNYNCGDESADIRRSLETITRRSIPPQQKWKLLFTSSDLGESDKKEIAFKIKSMIDGYTELIKISTEVTALADNFPAQAKTIKAASENIAAVAQRLATRYTDGDYREQDMLAGAGIINRGDAAILPIFMSIQIQIIASCFKVDLKKLWLADRTLF